MDECGFETDKRGWFATVGGAIASYFYTTKTDTPNVTETHEVTWNSGLVQGDTYEARIGEWEIWDATNQKWVTHNG